MKFISALQFCLIFLISGQVFGQGKIRTYTSEDWDYWEISGAATGKIRIDGGAWQ